MKKYLYEQIIASSKTDALDLNSKRIKTLTDSGWKIISIAYFENRNYYGDIESVILEKEVEEKKTLKDLVQVDEVIRVG